MTTPGIRCECGAVSYVLFDEIELLMDGLFAWVEIRNCIGTPKSAEQIKWREEQRSTVVRIQ